MKSLGTRFLLPFGLLIVLFSSFVLFRTYEISRQHAYDLVNQQAELALEFNLAIRNYAADKIRPNMEKLLGKDGFITETMSTSYISRSIIEEVRKKFPDYVVRFSSEDPRNPSNMANADEIAMIQYFRSNPQDKRRTSEIVIEGQRYLAHFTPKIMKQDCLRCHGEPTDAPAELIRQYGSKGSFYRKVGDVAGLDMIAVPVERVNAVLATEIRKNMIALVVGLAILFGSIMVIFKLAVTRRLATISGHFQQIASQTESTSIKPIKVTGHDEISVLGSAFNQLVERLHEAHSRLEDRVRQRTAELAKANAELRNQIAERHHAESELRETKQQLSDIIEFLPDATLVLDREGKVIAWNRVIEAMTGIRAEDMLGRGNYEYAIPFYGERRPILIDQALHPDPEMEKHYTTIQRFDDSVFGESYVTHLPSGHAHLSATATVLRDEKGDVVAAIECIRDNTERKQAEEVLKETNETLNIIIQSSPLAIIAVDPDGNVTRWNSAAEQIFGWLESEVLGQFLPLVSEEKREEHLTLCKRVLGGEGFTNVEVRRQKKDGSLIDISVSISPLRDSRGQITGIMSLNADITDRKRAEEERRELEERLIRAEKMEALGLLAGGVAHDLNNVLGILVGYSELLLDDIDRESPLRSHVEYIRQGGERAAAIVQDLLTLARRGVQNREIVDLNVLIDDFRKSPEFEKIRTFHPRVSVETSLSPDLLKIKGSPVHLLKTVMNLVSNAAEAMPAGGRLVIATENRYLDRPVPGYDQIQEGDYVVVLVTDTGEGISEADMKRIFEPFYTKKVMGRSGTGLGLAVVWGTVKDHNGYINVQSEEKKGTTFFLYFPVTREEVPHEGSSLPATAYLGKCESILVVDDVQGQRDLAVQMLQKLNYEVASVASGEEAIEYLKNNKADLLILDMIMDPGMDGLDTYKEIMKRHPRQKAIIVSGFSESDRVRQAQALGAGAYVRKPYVREQLGLAVRNELDRSA